VQNVQSSYYCMFRCKPLCKVIRKIHIMHGWIGSPSMVQFWFHRDHTDNKNGVLPTQPHSELSLNTLKHIKNFHITTITDFMFETKSVHQWYSTACFQINFTSIKSESVLPLCLEIEIHIQGNKIFILKTHSPWSLCLVKSCLSM
jgi:hypothetical protein